MRTGEKMIYNFSEGISGLVFFKGLDRIEGGREASEIEVGPADEIAPGGRFVG